MSQVLAARGLTSFLAAVQATPLGFQLAQPGFMATVLAPNNAAFTNFLKGEAYLWRANRSPWGMQALALARVRSNGSLCLTFCAKVQQFVETDAGLGASKPCSA